jgi:metal-responsive CopG/Arc/MetJ family transcriptional regulator
MRAYLSIPDDLVAEADQMAKELNLTRSQFYAKAMEAYLAKHKRDGSFSHSQPMVGTGGAK